MPKITVYFFYNDDCPHCHKIIPFIKSLKRKYTGVGFKILEVHYNKENMSMFNLMNKKLGKPATMVPEVIVDNHVLIGSDEIPTQLENIIKEMIK